MKPHITKEQMEAIEKSRAILTKDDFKGYHLDHLDNALENILGRKSEAYDVRRAIEKELEENKNLSEKERKEKLDLLKKYVTQDQIQVVIFDENFYEENSEDYNIPVR